MTILVGYVNAQRAQALTVEEIRENMTRDEQFAYKAGIIDAFAIERFLSNPRDEDGMNCIIDWYYNSEDERSRLFQQEDLFDQHPDRQVAVLLYSLFRQECGD